MRTTRIRLTVGAAVVLAGITAGTRAPVAQAPAAQAKPSAAAAATRATWYFYKVKWGFQDEFLDLFQRNHYPVLKARLDAGYYVSIRTFTPTYHGDGRADWTFAVELVERTGATGAPTEQEIVRKLYPDAARFRAEERRRFELLEAHWDVPLTAVDFEARALTTMK
jgi:hypothetical protein